MTETDAHRSSRVVRDRHLAADTSGTCGLVDVLIGLKQSSFIRFEAEDADAALLFAEVRRLLNLQAQALRMRYGERVHEIRLGRLPDEPLS